MRQQYKTRVKEFLRKTLRLKVKPWRIALSLALGVFAGFAVPIGLQTIFVTPIALLLQCNVPLTLTATLVSNPLTVVPLYYLYFRIGESLTSIHVSGELLAKVMESPTITNISQLSFDAVILFFVGSVLIGIIAGLITYLVSLRLIIWYRLKKGINLNGI